MITTLTLNPCIDKTITVDGFKYGELNRVVGTRADISGKGINVSIAVHQLGEGTKCLGFNYKNDSSILRKGLEDIGIQYDLVDVEGTLRTNIKVFDQPVRIMTELNESGHYVNEEAIETLKKLVVHQAETSDIMVFNGSVPQGVPKNIYRTLIESVKEKGVKTVLDAEGELLLEGIKAEPYFIKPNLFEFENAFNIKIKDKIDVVKLSRKIISTGVKIVCVSLGSSGAIIVSEDEAYFAPANKLDVKGLQGAGDSLVAGICIAIKQKLGIEEMLRYGVAAANASLIREGTLLCTKEEFERMLPSVNIEKITL